MMEICVAGSKSAHVVVPSIRILGISSRGLMTAAGGLMVIDCRFRLGGG